MFLLVSVVFFVMDILVRCDLCNLAGNKKHRLSRCGILDREQEMCRLHDIPVLAQFLHDLMCITRTAVGIGCRTPCTERLEARLFGDSARFGQTRSFLEDLVTKLPKRFRFLVVGDSDAQCGQFIEINTGLQVGHDFQCRVDHVFRYHGDRSLCG